MYDIREPYKITRKALSFCFNPNRYEIWKDNILVDKGIVNGVVECKPSLTSKAKSEVTFFNFPKSLKIKKKLLLDMTFTCGDRIYLVTIPRNNNINDFEEFQIFKSNLPSDFPIETRESGFFTENEPYECSIFTINNKITKISFLFGNNPRLISLYNDRQPSFQNNHIYMLIMAHRLIEILIEEWEDGDAHISESSFLFDLKSEFPKYNFPKEIILNLLDLINSIIPGKRVITRFPNKNTVSKSLILMTDHNKSDLDYILNKLKIKLESLG